MIFLRTMILVLTAVLLVLFFGRVAMATGTNNIPSEYLNSHFAWGEQSNELRAGLVWDDETRDGSKIQRVEIVVLTSKTNVVLDYVKTPNEKFSKIEFRDSDGTLITPLLRKAMDGELPQKIQMEDLPRTPKFGRNNSLLAGALPLFQNHAVPLKEFVLQDVYQIKKVGDYTITIWPTVYKLATNGQFVTRIDLPSVSAKIPLKTSLAE